MAEITVKLLNEKIEHLEQKVESILRSQQSEKDKAIAKTNQRIDRLERAFAEFLRQESE